MTLPDGHEPFFKIDYLYDAMVPGVWYSSRAVRLEATSIDIGAAEIAPLMHVLAARGWVTEHQLTHAEAERLGSAMNSYLWRRAK